LTLSTKSEWIIEYPEPLEWQSGAISAGTMSQQLLSQWQSGAMPAGTFAVPSLQWQSGAMLAGTLYVSILQWQPGAMLAGTSGGYR
jgi:hypothetical protein